MNRPRFIALRLCFFGLLWRIASKIQQTAGHVAAFGYHNECRAMTEDTRRNRRHLSLD